MKVKPGWREEKEWEGWDNRQRSERAPTEMGWQGQEAVMWANREVNNSFYMTKMGGKCRNERELKVLVPDSRVKEEMKGRRDTLTFGGVNHWACPGKRRVLLEWRVCWAKTLIRRAVLPCRCQRIGEKGDVCRMLTAQGCRWNGQRITPSSTSFPMVNIYDNHKLWAAWSQTLSLRRLKSPAFIRTIQSIAYVSTLQRRRLQQISYSILFYITLYTNVMFLA